MNASSHSVSDFCCVRRTFHEKHLLRVFSQKAAFVENNYNTSVFEGRGGGGGGGVRAGRAREEGGGRMGGGAGGGGGGSSELTLQAAAGR